MAPGSHDTASDFTAAQRESLLDVVQAKLQKEGKARASCRSQWCAAV